MDSLAGGLLTNGLLVGGHGGVFAGHACGQLTQWIPAFRGTRQEWAKKPGRFFGTFFVLKCRHPWFLGPLFGTQMGRFSGPPRQ